MPDQDDSKPFTDQSPLFVSIYSEAEKDADFNGAAQKALNHIFSSERPRLVLDFRNILFLYPQELQTLKNLADHVAQKNGVLSFINCEGELFAIFSRNPLFAPLLDERQNI